MTWTNALGLCPRCDGPVEKGLLLCSRCGLELVAPEYLGNKVPAEMETSVLQPVVVPHKPESRVPAVLVICAVIVLGTWAALAALVRQDGTAQATPHTTPTPLQLAIIATQPPKSLSQAAKLTRTPTPPLTVYTATPPAIDTPQPPLATQPPPAATDTPVPQAPTAAAAPEAQPAKLLPGIGTYASDLNDWWVKLDGLGTRPVLWSSNPNTRHEPQGIFWLAYVVYRNDSDTPRALGTTVDFTLKGSDGQSYPEYSGGGRDPQRKNIPLALQANPLDFTTAPGQRTATVLVFDLPPGVDPAQLVASVLDGDTTSPAAQVAWDLSNTP
ncbi:MAG TPA: hypothetical protein VF826_16445 [Chloroflexia bacterium]|jgi:hypothetical protein